MGALGRPARAKRQRDAGILLVLLALGLGAAWALSYESGPSPTSSNLSWFLETPHRDLTPSTTEFEIIALASPSHAHLVEFEIDIEYSRNTILVRVTEISTHVGPVDAMGVHKNFVIRLDQPLGNRKLVDGSGKPPPSYTRRG